MTVRAPLIAVAGSSIPTAHQREMAVATGRLLAEHGAVVLCGGLGGVMEAVASGVSERGGLCIGLLPGADSSQANPHVDIALATGLGEGRNVVLARACDAMVAIGGGFGTLSEIALGVRLGRPTALIDSWEFSEPSTPMPATLQRFDTAEEAVTWLLTRPGLDPRRDGRPPRA